MFDSPFLLPVPGTVQLSCPYQRTEGDESIANDPGPASESHSNFILRHNAQQSTHCREMRKLDQKILIHSLLCVYSGSRTISKLLWLLRCRSRNNPAENNGSKNDDDTSACDSRHRLTSSTTHMLCRWHTLQTWFDIIAHWHAGRESTPAESCVRTYIVKCPAYQKYQSGAASFRVASSLDTQH